MYIVAKNDDEKKKLLLELVAAASSSTSSVGEALNSATVRVQVFCISRLVIKHPGQEGTGCEGMS
jgi:hypothetical protein